jgi:hypothetical protein
VAVSGGPNSYGITWRTGNSSVSSVYAAVLPALPTASPAPPTARLVSGASPGHAPEIVWADGVYRLVWRTVNGSVSARVDVASMLENGTISISATALTDFILPRTEPVILTGPAGHAQVLWLEGDPVDSGLRRLVWNTLSTTNTVTRADTFAWRVMDKDTLAAATGPDGTILAVYPTGHYGKELHRTGELEMVLIFPQATAQNTPLSLVNIPVNTGTQSVLTWSWNAHFPPDAGLIETSTDLRTWSPLTLASPRIPLTTQVQGAQNEVRFSYLSGPRRYYRLNAGLPGR